jgi:hypothetical protein
MRAGIAPLAGSSALRPMGLQRGGTPVVAYGGLVVPARLALELSLRAGLRVIGVPREDPGALSDRR